MVARLNLTGSATQTSPGGANDRSTTTIDLRAQVDSFIQLVFVEMLPRLHNTTVGK
jgi:hypothetical protein